MIQDKGEAISALVDDEMSAREVATAVDSLLVEEGLARRWERYHLVRDALHHNLPDHPECDLAERIRKQLEAEPTPLRSRRRPDWHHVSRQTAGLAVAASVTVAVFLGVWQWPGQQTPAEEAASTAEANGGATEADLARVAADSSREATAGSGSERSAASIERYLVNHSEYAGSSSMRGMLPYTRVVGGGEAQAAHEGR
ncbi:MAG: sigma-E factor negative regulatory protein [Thiohalospira sp.]|uniref:sigma-E factor negative regulatory protein n=1 Tax=Thiohalospira sp. TaxID=3080549 RepID=UPI0039816CF3